MASIQSIQHKLNLLKASSRRLVVFGASTHRYQFAAPVAEHELTCFESKFQLTLPPGYREFLKVLGNGGAGPYYGIVSLQSGLFADLDYKQRSGFIDPSKPFSFTEAWNMNLHEADDETYLQLRDEHYFDNEWVNGMLRICNYGCGVSINLVVNGPAYGQIWVDDRCNDGGIYPDKHFGNTGSIGFLEWYHLWLDQSLALVAQPAP
jgi:SMI1 / KNR4 family (SUKH-1)